MAKIIYAKNTDDFGDESFNKLIEKDDGEKEYYIWVHKKGWKEDGYAMGAFGGFEGLLEYLTEDECMKQIQDQYNSLAQKHPEWAAQK